MTERVLAALTDNGKWLEGFTRLGYESTFREYCDRFTPDYLAAVRELVDAVTASKAKIAELEACKSAKDDAAEPVSGEKACPICGAVSDSKFCPHCGAPMGD